MQLLNNKPQMDYQQRAREVFSSVMLCYFLTTEIRRTPCYYLLLFVRTSPQTYIIISLSVQKAEAIKSANCIQT